MKTKDERAAAMRDVYLGFTASADLTWDELPQRHRDRWLATLDAAQPEVPQGVPSVEELAIIAWNEMRGLYPRMGLYDQANPLEQGTAKAVAAAIRDAVLRGAEQPSSNAGQLPDDEVEALARVLQSAWTKSRGLKSRWEDYDDLYQDGYRAEARAAIAHLRERSAVTVPQGVPEIKALREIGINAYLMHEQAKRENAGCIVGPMQAAATAIRDRVLAGVQAAPPPLIDEIIERMAKAHMGVISPSANWEHTDKQYYMNAIRAALAAVGPQYCPADVAFSSRVPELEKQIAQLRREREDARREVDEVRRHISVTMSREHQARKEAQEAKRELSHLHPGETVDGVILERDHYRIRLEHAEQDVAALRAELAELRDQVDDDNTNAAAVNDLLIKLQNVTAERDALKSQAVPGKIQWSIDADGVSQNIWRDHALHVSPIICARVMGELFNHAVIDAQQSQAVPVKPRFDVTAEELAEMFQNIKVEICDAYLPWGHLGENYKEDFTKAFEKLLPELAAHAVTDVPPGLPTVEDIISAWEQSDDSISPIRFTYDRLAPYLHEPTGWELDLSNDDFWDLIAEKPGYTQEDGIKVEILKRIRPTFKREYSEADVKALSEVLRGVAYKGYRHAARAALDWMGATVGECKECEKLKEQRKALRKIVIDSAEEVRARIDASRAALEGE